MMVYACISPLLMPFCVLFFSASYMMYKYQLLYVYVNAYQSGGEMWYMVFSKSILGLMFAACAMLSFFSLDVMNSYSTVRSLRGPHAATRRHLVLLEALRSPVHQENGMN